MNKPLCFVVMPFGEKKDSNAQTINFDEVYDHLIKPALESAQMEAIRADGELVGGIIHKPMYERLILSDYVIADLSIANANVYYELGVRHAVRPYTTLAIFNDSTRLPFDVQHLRGFPYAYEKGNVKLLKGKVNGLTQLLNAARDRKVDSPVFQLVDGIKEQDSIAHAKTDIFREKIAYNIQLKQQLQAARNVPGRTTQQEAVQSVVASIGNLEDQEIGVLIDILLSYRATSDFESMVTWVEKLPKHVSQTIMVQEQYGLALNRLGKWDQARAVLEAVIEEHGASSETYGILGRVYKDQYQNALSADQQIKAQGFLEEAINTYLKGFEADWRDAYPGVNSVSLMAVKDPPDSRITELLPVVKYAVKRKIAQGKPDYWDYATLLELAVIEQNQEEAFSALTKASTLADEAWKPETTLNNLQNIMKVRLQNNRQQALWMEQIGQELQRLSTE